jgi:hypothetical protein
VWVATFPFASPSMGFDTFYLGHRRCGELEAGVEPAFVWMVCDCGGELRRPLLEPSKDK